jgi:cell wall-associated NlpC family hydrolase
VRTARLFLGVPYLWGGRSPLGLDCSGFVQLVYGAAGVALPRDARDQCTRLGGIACLRRWPGGPPLRACADGAQARGRAGRPAAGDLLFFGPASGAVTHVALSLGGLRVVHAFGSVREAGLDPAGPDFEAELFENFLGFGSASRLAPGTPSGEST